MKVCASCLFLFFAGLSAGMSQYGIRTNAGGWDAYLQTANTNGGPPYTNAIVFGYNGPAGWNEVPQSIAGALVRTVSAPGGLSSYFNLTGVSIPGTVDTIDAGAFSGCVNLNSVSIGNGVTNIGPNAFANCTGLTGVSIPDSVTQMNSSFSGCTNLHSVTVGPWIGGFFSGNGAASCFTPQVPHYIVRSGVTQIGINAFSDCTGMISVSIPDSVTNIGNNAFGGCASLTSVGIPSSVSSISWRAFSRSGLQSVSIPKGVTALGGYAFANCTNLSTASIGSGVTSLDVGTFSGCTSLATVSIGNNVTNIGQSAFSGCVALPNIMIPSSVSKISDYGFSGSGLRSISIPSSVTSIGQYAFASCSQLTSAIIPASVEYLDPTVFYNCPNLTTVLVEGNYRYLGGLPQTNVYYLPGATGWQGTGARVFVPSAVQPLYTVATGFRFSWTGTGSMPMNVQRTTTLGGPWTVVSSNNTTGQFIDPNTPVTKAFYRAILP